MNYFKGRIILLVLIAILNIFQVLGQSQADIQTPKLVPPSPDAATLGKYGQIPVNKSTGVPSISIPLYEIKTPRFTVPISLSYHASGIKVEEIAGWTGAGWALNAGGVITRSIVGLPDDGGYGFLNNTIKTASQIQFMQDFQYVANVLARLIDTEPDNFFYNFNGHSGSLVFGQDRQPVLVPYAPLKVQFNHTTNFNTDNFYITDEEGNHYTFSDKEMVVSGISNSMSGISSWYLSQMISADLSDTVQFVYTTDTNPQNTFCYNFSQNIAPNWDPQMNGPLAVTQLQPMVTSMVENQYYTVRISSILFKGGKVDFIPKGGRLDDGLVSLDSVIVSGLNPATGGYTRVKSFKLLTDYYYSSLPVPPIYPITVSEANRHRLKLTGLVENDANNVATRTYQFDYNPAMPPYVPCFAQDHWGYYNGKYTNPTLLEATQVTYTPAAGSPPQIVTIGWNGQTNLGADRSVSESDMQAGILQKITYPTKGYTTFAYESNKLAAPQNVQYTVSVPAFGLLGTGGTKEIDTVYYTPTGEMLANGGTVFTVLLHTGTTASGAAIPSAKLIRVSDGVKIYSSADNGSTNTEIDNLILPLDPNVKYAIITEAHGTTGGQVASTTPYAIMTTRYTLQQGYALTNVEGLRVASMKNYDGDGSLLSTETYKYGLDESGGGDRMATYNTYHYSRTCSFVYNEQPNGLPGIQSGSVDTYSNHSFYPLASFDGSPVAYAGVTVYHGDLEHNTGKSVYKYIVFPDSPLVCAPQYLQGFKPIPGTWKNGMPNYEGHYRSIGNNLYALVQEKITGYDFYWKKPAVGTNIGYFKEPMGYAFQAPFSNANGVFTGLGSSTVQWFDNSFYWFDYPISSGVRVPTSTVINNYDSTGTSILMTNTTNYYYDDTTLFLPTRTVTADSRGRTLTTYAYRPPDKAAINALTPLSANASVGIDSLMAKNILTPVIQLAQYVNSNLTQLSLSNYQVWNSHLIAPATIQKLVSGGPLETRLQFNQYDGSGNPLEMQKANDVSEVYLWGYHGQYPVAKIQGTTYAVASTYITQNVLDNPPDDATLRAQLNNLRNIPGALVTTFTYQPLVGMTSMTDPQGKTTFYEYDAFSRLKDIKDLGGNVIKTFDYHYAQ